MDISSLANEFERVDAWGGHTLLPEGEYDVMIIKAVEGETKNGDQYCKLLYKVTSGDYNGKIIQDAFFFRSPDAKARSRTLSRWKSLSLAIGFTDFVYNTDLVLTHSMHVTITIYKNYNSVNRYAPLSQSQPQPRQQPQSQVQSVTPPPAQTPWG
mgnify:CR=1 FL=1